MGVHLVTLSSTQVLNMLLILVLVSTALSNPIEWDAKDPKLRSLLESGGPADTTGSWTPDYTPEVKAALKFFIDSYNTVELGGLELLQAKQIPNAYIADTPEVAAAMAAFEAAEMGKHAEMVPVNNDIQAGQIASAYLDDTEAVVKAKAAHMTAVEDAAAAAEMSSEEMMATPTKMVAPVKMAQPVIYHQPLMHYQIPHYLPTTYNIFGR